MKRYSVSFLVAGLALGLAACDQGGVGTSTSPIEPEVVRAPRAEITDPASFPQATNVCVSMRNGGDRVAGMQVDLRWDATCMGAPVQSEGAGNCVAHQATGKDVHSRVYGSSLRALVLSLTDVAPIPDGELFCCQFRKSADACCELRLNRLVVSDAKGERIDDSQIAFEATVGGAQCAAISAGAE